MVAIGEVIDEKYRITRLIGEGGMGAVFEGENLNIGRRVAIKVLHAGVASNKQAVERFQREARAAGRIGNDHILEVLDLGKLPDGDHYMVLEFLDGEPLSNRIERLGKLTPSQLVPLATQMLDGLGAAHRAGIVHRDLKPDNIFILKEKAGRKDFVKIIDFGISKFSPLTGGGDSGMKMTQTGAIMGTPYYMSPEQARGTLEIDARSDIYSLGVILYEAVTGTVPFTGTTVNELMFNIVLTEPRPVRELVPDIDAGFEAIIARSLSKDRERRFQTTDELATALAQWSQGTSARIFLPEVAAQPTVGPSQPPAAIPTGSTESWTQSQADAAPPRLSKGMIGAAVAGSLVLAGAIGVFAFSGEDSDAAASPSSTSETAVTPPPPTGLAPTAVETAKTAVAENPNPPATSASGATQSASGTTSSPASTTNSRKPAVAHKRAPAPAVTSPPAQKPTAESPKATAEPPKKNSVVNQFGY